MDLGKINFQNKDEFTFISETLINFDQILRATTIDLWQFHTEKARQNSAATNLKSKMAAIAIQSATESTALAIARATEAWQETKTTNAQTNLRISNLERSIRRHEQKTNELNNNIKLQQHKNPQKNVAGSRLQGSLASPFAKTLAKKQNNQLKQKFVDLTEEEDEAEILPEPAPKLNKKRKVNESTLLTLSNAEAQRGHTGKAVHWKETKEIQQFNPQQPISTVLHQLPGAYQAAQNPNLPQPLTHTYFQPAPPPIPLQAPSFPNTFSALQVSPFHNPHFQSTQTPNLARPISQTLQQHPYQHQNQVKARIQIKHPVKPRRGKGKARTQRH